MSIDFNDENTQKILAEELQTIVDDELEKLLKADMLVDMIKDANISAELLEIIINHKEFVLDILHENFPEDFV